MGICPRCGSWVDEGAPYCPECCYSGDDDSDPIDSGFVTINGREYDIRDVEDALEELGYDIDDLKSGFVDEDELEELLESY